MNQTFFIRSARLLGVLAACILVGAALFWTAKYTYPFIIAVVFAFFLNPAVDFLERKARFPRGLAVLASLLLLISLFAGLITLLVVEIVSGADYLSRVVPRHLLTLTNFLENFITGNILPIYNRIALLFKNLESGQQETIIENVQNIGQSFASSAGGFIQSLFQNIPVLFSWIPNTATVLVFSLLATFFISKDWHRLLQISNRILPVRVYSSTGRVIADLRLALFGFIKAQCTLISITAVTVLAGLLILRIRYSITIALICGLVDILPYLGTGTVFVPWIVYEFITGNTKLGAGLAILYVIVIIQRQLLEPKVLSSSIGLDPLATLIALFSGYKLFGFIGLIAGPVILVIINTLQRAGVFHDLWNFIIGDSREK